MDLLKNWRAQGKIREDIDEDLLPVFFDSLVYIDTHKDEIGIQHFPQNYSIFSGIYYARPNKSS